MLVRHVDLEEAADQVNRTVRLTVRLNTLRFFFSKLTLKWWKIS